jgi:hypothetical protein
MSKIVPDVKGGIADKLVKLSLEIENRKETTDLGDYVTAIASLKSMLATYEGLYRETLENLTMAIGNTSLQNVAQMAIAKASEKPSIESLDAQYTNGQIDDVTYQLLMLEHHNIEIVLE